MIEAPNMTEFRKGVESLNEGHVDFIREELGITPEQITGFTDEEFNQSVYEPMCDIEIEELVNCGDEPESERCIIASDIVTILGNSIAAYNGWN